MESLQAEAVETESQITSSFDTVTNAQIPTDKVAGNTESNTATSNVNNAETNQVENVVANVGDVNTAETTEKDVSRDIPANCAMPLSGNCASNDNLRDVISPVGELKDGPSPLQPATEYPNIPTSQAKVSPVEIISCLTVKEAEHPAIAVKCGSTQDPPLTDLQADIVCRMDDQENELTPDSAAEAVGDMECKAIASSERAPSMEQHLNLHEQILASPMEIECDKTESSNQVTAAANTSDGLSLLAAYSSDNDTDGEGITQEVDSDNDDVIEVPTTDKSTGPRQVVAVSSSSDSSSDSDSESENEYLTVLRNKIDKRINTEDVDEDDDDFEDDARPRRRQPPKVRGEMLLDELPPIHQLEITVPEDECIELGKVQSIVDQLVLVSVIPNSMLFDLDTVLFLDKGRKVLGQVFDVLGQVADPIYCVRFNSNQQIKERDIKIGDTVYCAPQTEHTQFVILSKLMQVRGSDASWEHDVEPPVRFIDYSDDEAEREARSEQRKRRQRDRTESTDTVETVSTVTTEQSEAAAPPRQRGRRAHREGRQLNNYNTNNQHQTQYRSQSRESEYNYHPSYNPGSWHSNYYHNYHAPPANFNIMPGMQFPLPTQGYGYMPPQHPYAMQPPMAMAMPPHMYPTQPPPPPPYGSNPYGQQQHPPNSGN